MVNTVDDELQSFGDDTLKVPCLKDLHDELLVECLDEQIKNPTRSHVYYLDEFKDEYDEDMEEAGDDSDEKKELNKIHDKFYMAVLEKIDNSFELNLDKDTAFSLSGENLRILAEGIYEFFVVDYVENLTTYFTSLIGKFQEALVNEIVKSKNSKDIVSNFYRDKIKDESYAVIIANMNGAINYVKNIETDADEFIDFFDSERFSVAIVKSAIENGIISGNFSNTFVKPIFDKSQGDVFDAIVVNTRQNIYNDYLESTKEK